MLKKIMNPLLAIFVFALLFIVFVRYLEATSVFYPDKEITATPDDINLEYEDLYFPSGPWQLNGWLVKAPGARNTIIFFHGNAGNISGRLEKIKLFRDLGQNVFIVDYRGYGRSQGSPDETGMYEDALAAYDYLVSRSDIKGGGIILYGESLGGVAAVEVASKRPVQCLILDSTFSSAADMSRLYYPYVPTFLLQLKLDNLSKIESISAPKLFLHSPDDKTVPFRLGMKLYKKAAPPKGFLKLTGTHNNGHISSQNVFIEGIKNFLKQNQLL